MRKTQVTLVPLKEEDREQFIKQAEEDSDFCKSEMNSALVTRANRTL